MGCAAVFELLHAYS